MCSSDLKRGGIKPSGCIVGEPTGMRLVSAHKGGRIHRCRVRGKAAHSSLTPTAVNAVQVAARIVALIDGIGRREQQTGLRDDGFDVPFTTISTNLFRHQLYFLLSPDLAIRSRACYEPEAKRETVSLSMRQTKAT